MITRPRKLERSDDRTEFSSGATDLDDWLRRYARQNQEANTAITYVCTDGSRVVGYYAIAMSSIERIHAPGTLQKSMPQQIPCILLARLAVDQEFRGHGVGAALLRDALLRAVHLSESIGAAGILIHCRDEEARRFYLANGDFLECPFDALQLMVSIKHLRSVLTSGT